MIQTYFLVRELVFFPERELRPLWGLGAFGVFAAFREARRFGFDIAKGRGTTHGVLKPTIKSPARTSTTLAPRAVVRFRRGASSRRAILAAYFARWKVARLVPLPIAIPTNRTA